ncbi:MAG TPA: nuclear transport factor 2 family protein [Hyphomicrobiaceae bacterium]|jgi:hypothetical protein|nr:nuclear transport factor 2 family protein [Hyphomicrobiaceae bacterium]
MTLSRRHLGLAGAVLASASLLPAVAEAASAKAEANLAAAINAMTKAMLSADKAQLEALMMPSVSFGHSSGLVQTRAQFIEAVVSKKEIFKSITLSDHKNSINGNNAVVRHVFEADIDLEGKPLKVKLGMLQVWHRQGGKWRLYARQAYKL